MKIIKRLLVLGIAGLALASCEGSNNTIEKYEFSLTYNDNECTVNSSHINGIYSKGTLISLSIEENEDYVYTGIYEDDTLVTSDLNYFFILDEDTSFTVKCEKVIHNYDFKINVVGEGNVSGSSNGTYVEGSTITLNASPNEGYHFDGYYEDDTLLSDDEVYTFNITKNIEITAKFALNLPKYSFSITSSEGGVVSGTTSGSYDEGTKIELSATPLSGYRFDGYYDSNDILVSSSKTYSFVLKSNTSLIAKFIEIGETDFPNDTELVYTITPGSNGVTKTAYDVVPIKEYYASFDTSLNGEELRDEIRRVTKVKKYYRYSSTSYCLSYIDESLSNPGKLLGIYDGKSINYPWDGGSTWNKEHIWPQSRFEGLSNNDTVKGDMHNLRASTPSVNSSRGNKPYNEKTDSTYYYPNLNNNVDFRGDVARMLFYMYAQYEDLKLVENPSGGLEMGKLSVLIEWNKLDPVDNFEIQRNMKVSQYQGNRNAFIDFPYLVDQLF